MVPKTDAEPGEIVQALLSEAGAASQLPTDDRKLLKYLGLEQMSFDFMRDDFAREIEALPDAPREAKEETKKLRAALSLGQRLVVTHSGLDAKRYRFSVFHEIGHYVLPEHREKLFLDTDETLSWWTHLRLEKEANQFAADLLFQGSRFTEESLEEDLSCRTVLELAPRFGASYESAMRRYVERHILPCCVIVYQSTGQDVEEGDPEDAQYRIQYTIASPPFRKRFFSRVETSEPLTKGSEIFQVHGTGNIKKIVESELVIHQNDKSKWRFDTELFTNGYKIFQFLIRPRE